MLAGAPSDSTHTSHEIPERTMTEQGRHTSKQHPPATNHESTPNGRQQRLSNTRLLMHRLQILQPYGLQCLLNADFLWPATRSILSIPRRQRIGGRWWVEHLVRLWRGDMCWWLGSSWRWTRWVTLLLRAISVCIWLCHYVGVRHIVSIEWVGEAKTCGGSDVWLRFPYPA